MANTFKVVDRSVTDALDGRVTNVDARLTTAESEIAALAASQSAGVIGYATKAELDADLDHDEHTVAYVTNDANPANNGTYRKVGASGSGSWVQSSRGWSAQDVAGLIGGADISPQTLIAWTEAESYEPMSVTRDSDGVLSTAAVQWPDGSAGTLTVTTRNDDWLAVDAYTITHDDSAKTVAQPAVTRDAETGAITMKPALTVS